MGCANTKQSRCKHCQNPYSPVPRSYSMHVHHPPQVQGDTYHVVALTSTTLGSLRLEATIDKSILQSHGNGVGETKHGVDQRVGDKRSIEFSMGLIEAKTWSDMIDEKIPKVISKTPTRTPPGEPETINAWEMMEGLEDLSPLRPSNHVRGFSFDAASNHSHDPFERFKSRLQENGIDPPSRPIQTPLVENDSCSKLDENGLNSPKQMWHQMGNENLNSNLDSIVSDFDPDVISTFRKSLEDLSPDKEKPSITTTTTESKKMNGFTTDHKYLPQLKEKVIIYFTSLRGVRKTYEDCCLVRVILKGLNVRVDERDVSMHSGFKDELKELLGDLISGVGLNLPRVFVGRKYIGGAEEIRRMNEEGKLEKMLECCQKVSDDSHGNENGNGSRSRICEACGDVRFVPCETCSGSCKIFYEGDPDYESDEKKEDEEKDDDDEEEEEDEDEEGDVEYGFRRCPDCNENGLIRCPVCCD